MTIMETISVCILPLTGILYLVLMIIHYPKRKLNNSIKKHILKNGLIHFTLWENAEKIQNEGLKPRQRKAMYPLEKDMVWLYINEENNVQTKCDIIHKKGMRKKYDAVVYFTDIDEYNLEKMKYRKSDMAIVHIGVFKPNNIVIQKLDDLKKEVRC